LFAQFGFDGLFLGRVDYQDFDARGQSKQREMLWQASANLEPSASTIFTGILPNGYGPPDGFCFDQFCGDDPFMDDKTLEDFNVDLKVDQYINYTIDLSKVYKTSNLINTMGSDFQYSNAHRWFKNLDKMIYYVNQRQETGSKINIFYSTTACYLYSLYRENTTWSTKNDDFFPYAHRPHSFWTGYFTSRISIKNMVRRTNNYLQSVRQLASFANLHDQETQNTLGILERAMGVAQHHDAVSGTERQHVANDYAKRLSIGTQACVSIIENSIEKILDKKLGFKLDLQNVIYCPLLNITECPGIESQNSFTAIVYNPLPRAIQSWIRIPTVTDDYEITNLNGSSTINGEYSTVYDETKKIPERKSMANFNLVFKADLAPNGMNMYKFTKKTQNKIQQQNKQKTNDQVSLENQYIKIAFDSDGNLIQIGNLDTAVSTPITQNICYYNSFNGNNSQPDFQASGAYIFRPLNNDPVCLNVTKFNLFNGKQFSEIHQIFNDWISQTIRLYQDSQHVEFEWQIGPIDMKDNVGKEVVTKFDTNLKSNGLFYTDSNGREMLTRKRNFRPTWNLTQTEYVSGNYYPINSRIFIRDEDSSPVKRQLTIVNDRSQGGSSIDDGSIEIMLHRRVLHDDSLGVSEPLNELGSDSNGLVANGLLHLFFNTTQNSARLHREDAHRINNRPLVFFTTQNFDLPGSNFSELPQITLPSNIHLLTLLPEYSSNSQNNIGTLLVRLEHFYELNEDSTLSIPVTLDLDSVFGSVFNIINVEELALGANMNVEDLNQRLKWNEESNKNKKNILKKSLFKGDKNAANLFTFNPMQIRTFRITYNYN
jgi:lysosomal alpha-mannosidase